MLFLKRIAFRGSSEGRELIRMKKSRKGPDWVDTVPSCFNVQYKLMCWPELPEKHRTAGVLRALSRMTVEPFDYQQMCTWTGLDAQDARALFELCLVHGWIKPAAVDDRWAA